MSGLLVKHGYEPIAVDDMEAANEKVAKPCVFCLKSHEYFDLTKS